MTSDSLITIFQSASGQLLTLLALPAVATVVCFLCGKSDGGRLARRVAVWMSLIQLGLSILIVASLYHTLEGSNRNLNRGRFAPIAVPGDQSDAKPGELGAREISGRTSWTLVPVKQATQNSTENRVPSSDIQFYLGVDGFNLWLIPLTSLIGLAAVALTWRNGQDNPGHFLGWLFLMQVGALGAFLSFDVILFFVFFELTLVPGLFLIGRYGEGSAKREAARTFFLYTLLGGAITLVGLIGTVAMNPTPLTDKGSEFIFNEDNLGAPKPSAGPITFSIPQLMHNSRVWDLYAAREKAAAIAQRNAVEKALEDAMNREPSPPRAMDYEKANEAILNAEKRSQYQWWLFIAMMAGFAVKLPIVPFHGWLPAAYSEAPAGVTMFLSAILAKLGAFGILRLAIPLHIKAANESGLAIFGVLAAIGVVYAALCAYAQTDMKKLAAYSSVSHLGLIVLGAFSLSATGVGGAAFHVIAHGLSAGLLFGLLAFLVDRFGSLDSNRYGGLMGRYPKFTFFFMIAILAGVGLPGLCNFIGEMGVISSLFDPRVTTTRTYALAICACAGVFLSAWYSMTLVRKVFFGPERIPAEKTDGERGDVSLREWSIFALLSLCCLVMGILPQWVINPMNAEIKLLNRLGQYSESLNRHDEVDEDRMLREKVRANPKRHTVPEEFQEKGPPQGGPPQGGATKGGPPPVSTKNNAPKQNPKDK